MLFSAIFLFTCVSFYLMSMELVNFMVNNTRLNETNKKRYFHFSIGLRKTESIAFWN